MPDGDAAPLVEAHTLTAVWEPNRTESASHMIYVVCGMIQDDLGSKRISYLPLETLKLNINFWA